MQQPIPRYVKIEGRKVYGCGALTVNGQRFVYYFGMCYGKKLYTFDLGANWSTSKRTAFTATLLAVDPFTTAQPCWVRAGEVLRG